MINCFSSAFSASFSFKSFGIVISKWNYTWAKNDLVVSPLKKQPTNQPTIKCYRSISFQITGRKILKIFYTTL